MRNAKDKVMMGSERRSMIMTEEEKEKTAYHEAGHALVMLHAKGHEPLHKVTIIPRGRALGVTMWLPERDKLAHTFNELNATSFITFWWTNCRRNYLWQRQYYYRSWK